MWSSGYLMSMALSRALYNFKLSLVFFNHLIEITNLLDAHTLNLGCFVRNDFHYPLFYAYQAYLFRLRVLLFLYRPLYVLSVSYLLFEYIRSG